MQFHEKNYLPTTGLDPAIPHVLKIWPLATLFDDVFVTSHGAAIQQSYQINIGNYLLLKIWRFLNNFVLSL